MGLTPTIALELLDSEAGYVIQSWEFSDCRVLQVGRSKDCDVIIGSPVVSRNHVCISCSNGGWDLHSMSRQGIVVDGNILEHVRLRNDLVFRLARQGPYLRFKILDEGESSSIKGTISFESLTTPLLVVDEAERDREINSVTDGDFFKDLKRRAAALRRPPSK